MEPALSRIIDSAGLAHGKSMQSYLTMMAVRLLEMRRILKPTGSIYLHCDPTASHYIKSLMDSIFGHDKFRSEIIWRRMNPTGRGSRGLANNADYLLYYVNGNGFIWNQPYIPHSSKYIDKFYRHVDSDGRRYTLGDLKGNGERTGNSGKHWRGIDPSKTGSHWAIPNLVLSEDAKSMSSQGKLDYLDHIGRIYWPPSGGMPRYKRYLDEMRGTALDTIWDDIRNLQSHSKERVGYPTQKPLALLERIIKASSNENDVVFDPFCGCATALVAAEALDRQWIGIDLSRLAVKLVLSRLQKASDEGALLNSGRLPDIHHRTDIPKRTDVGNLPPYKTHRHTLYGKQEGLCAGCQHHFPFRNFTADHIVPRSKGGDGSPGKSPTTVQRL